MSQTDRIIAHIDMNSYFASVEQQARPALRNRPIAVVGPSKRSIIIAASVEAKLLGIKTGTPIPDALKICPKLIMIKADCAKYAAISKKLIEIFTRYTNKIEIFSIDEVFVDLSDIAQNLDRAREIVIKIKNTIKEVIGQNIRCSAGIGSNKLIAKLASEYKKPDGLVLVPCGKEIEFVDRFNLDDICGIGRQTRDHLYRLGIHSFADLRTLSQTHLTLIFNSYGLRLYNAARGIDQSPVKPYFVKTQSKSISRSKTLEQNTYDKGRISNVILFFCQEIAEELKTKKLTAGAIGLYLRFGDFSHGGESKKILLKSDVQSDLFFHLKLLIKKIKIEKPVRKIGVWVSALEENQGQLYLLERFSKARKIEEVSRVLNQKFGKKIVQPASTINLHLSPSPSYGFKRDIL